MSALPEPAWLGKLDFENFAAVGIDLVSVAQMRKSITDFGERYLLRIFTDHEILYCRSSLDPAPHFAARFAAKEATVKALRVEGVQPPWNSIEVHSEPGGSCRLRLSGAALELAQQRGIGEFTVSLSHEGDVAAAIVVATTSS
jgi:holo-[acyl-carrier protein] synthase